MERNSTQTSAEIRDQYGISLDVIPMKEEDVEKSPYILIRHGLSWANLDKMVNLKTYGKDSREY